MPYLALVAWRKPRHVNRKRDIAGNVRGSRLKSSVGMHVGDSAPRTSMTLFCLALVRKKKDARLCGLSSIIDS